MAKTLVGRHAPPLDRFWASISPEPNTGCWLWLGYLSPGASKNKNMGYGQFQVQNRRMPAHRFSYETFVGPVQEGLEIDHKCKLPCCVNPDHLEAVTHHENMRRSGAMFKAAAVHKAKTHCPRGHAYAGDNVFINSSGGRSCRECVRAQSRDSYHRRKRRYG